MLTMLYVVKRVYGDVVFQQDDAMEHIAISTVQLIRCKTPNFFL